MNGNILYSNCNPLTNIECVFKPDKSYCSVPVSYTVIKLLKTLQLQIMNILITD